MTTNKGNYRNKLKQELWDGCEQWENRSRKYTSKLKTKQQKTRNTNQGACRRKWHCKKSGSMHIL